MHTKSLKEISSGLTAGAVIPYLGPKTLLLDPENCPVPATPEGPQ